MPARRSPIGSASRPLSPRRAPRVAGRPRPPLLNGPDRRQEERARPVLADGHGLARPRLHPRRPDERRQRPDRRRRRHLRQHRPLLRLPRIGVAVISYPRNPRSRGRRSSPTSRTRSHGCTRTSRATAAIPTRSSSRAFRGRAVRGARRARPGAARGARHRPSVIKGFVSVSGAGLDFTDAELAARPTARLLRAALPERRRDRRVDARRVAGALHLSRVAAGARDLRRGDPADLRRQGQVLAEDLRRAGVPSSTTVVPGSSHTRIILTLSRADTVSAQAILKFVDNPRPAASRPTDDAAHPEVGAERPTLSGPRRDQSLLALNFPLRS